MHEDEYEGGEEETILRRLKGAVLGAAMKQNGDVGRVSRTS